jgi:glutamate-1-semialdehyde 2,1-aminomutase
MAVRESDLRATYAKSAAFFARAQMVITGGASREAVLRAPHPIYAAEARGCYVTDVDGRQYVDFVNNMGSLIHGHAYPAIVAAVTAQLQRGTASTFAAPEEVSFAEHLTSRSHAFEQIRFMNSGTEAVMAMLKAARAYTGRPKIAKVEGAYHGAYDYAEVSQNASPSNWGSADSPASVGLSTGTPKAVLDDVIIIPFNEPDIAAHILDAHRNSIAGVLIDPIPHRVGLFEADCAFVNRLDAWTKATGALLLFDEVITFRTEYGGAQQRFTVGPDLTALGKIIGGGFPVGAVAGRAEVMSVFAAKAGPARLPMSGTFNANPITMTAGRIAMEHFDNGAVRRLNALGDAIRTMLRQVIAEVGADASVSGAGSMFRIHLCSQVPTSYRMAYIDKQRKARLDHFLTDLLDAGVMLANTGAGMLSTVMGEEEADRLRLAVRRSLQRQ